MTAIQAGGVFLLITVLSLLFWLLLKVCADNTSSMDEQL